MSRLLLILVWVVSLCSFAHSAEPTAAPAYEIKDLPSPAISGASTPALSRAPDGTVWLSWIEPTATGFALRCASLNATTGLWREASTITTQVIPIEDNSPALTAGPNGQLTALWSAPPPTPRAPSLLYFGTSTDSGRTWTAPAPLTKESDATSHAALATLADGRVLASWLDHRDRKPGNRGPRLYVRVLSATPALDVLIDPLVSESASPALTTFPDGSALLAYRGRSDSEIRDIHIARYRSGAWEESRVLNHDEWRVSPSFAESPQLASAGGRVASAWFTGADNNPRVQVSTSPDAGERFLMPLTADLGHPIGRPAVTLLHDGALLTIWREGASSERDAQPAGLWLRRVSPDFALDTPVLLAADAVHHIQGQPRVAIVRDFTGENTTATLLVTFTSTGSTGTVRTLLVTVPEVALLAAANSDCQCAPTPEQLLGYPIRGAITAINADTGELTAQHAEIPGLLPGGAHVFKVTPQLLQAVQPGREFLGRIEQRAGAWWLFDVRLLVSPPVRKK
jgi:hypothetical protein